MREVVDYYLQTEIAGSSRALIAQTKVNGLWSSARASDAKMNIRHIHPSPARDKHCMLEDCPCILLGRNQLRQIQLYWLLPSLAEYQVSIEQIVEIFYHLLSRLIWMFSFLNNPPVWFGHTIWGGFSNINCNQDIRILSGGKISVLGRRAIHPRRRARWTTNHQKAIPQRIEICI